MNDNNDEQSEPIDQPEVPTASEEAAPEPKPSQVHDAVRSALANEMAQHVVLSSCPCGSTNVNLMIDLPQGSKVGRATCGACGTWGVDFLAPRTQDQDLLGKVAAKAWNEAPRITATDPA